MNQQKSPEITLRNRSFGDFKEPASNRRKSIYRPPPSPFSTTSALSDRPYGDLKELFFKDREMAQVTSPKRI